MDKVISNAGSADKGRFRFQKEHEGEEESWWFASTAIPLVAATVGPLANVLSIAALVVSWRMSLVPGGLAAEATWDGDESVLVPQLNGVSFADPHWCYDLNLVSLVAGFAGNLFLLLNFTNRVRYIIALPASIILWYISTGLLIAITISINVYDPPIRPQQTYTQGFWYGVIAAVLYLICSMSLMVNMLGYFLGHYGQHFNLTEAQRTLILQTMMFFIWLAGGAGVFAKIETSTGGQQWLFTDALYFCDVTILTVGFGDLYPEDDVGRGIVFPYTVGGTIMLGLVISSLTRFTKEIAGDRVIRRRVESARQRTVELSKEGAAVDLDKRQLSLNSVSPPARPAGGQNSTDKSNMKQSSTSKSPGGPVMDFTDLADKYGFKAAPRQKEKHKSRAVMLREEKDRFEAMRRIQYNTQTFKRYMALTASVLAFGMLWCVGALVFFYTEKYAQGLSYFQSLYFAYVSLLTIGYGDESPKSNAGRPFFVVWSLIAVPTMTILISDMGDTVIGSFKRGTSLLADFTILPKHGIWRSIIEKNPKLLGKLQAREQRKEQEKRLEQGFQAGIDEQNREKSSDGEGSEREEKESPTVDELAKQKDRPLTDEELAGKLARKIRATAQDLKEHEPRKYTYEEWVEITELIRFSSKKRQKRRKNEGNNDTPDGRAQDQEDAESEDLVEWDWIGENSPMMAFGTSEPEFVLDRLCESMVRYVKAQVPDDS